MLKRISIVAGVALLVACGGSSAREGFDNTQGGVGNNGVGGGDNGPIGGQQAGENPAADECQKMDIVFVVDDSGSMSEEQTNLVRNFPKFMQVLDSFKTKSGAKLDWRVAVTTTGRDVTYSVQPPGFPSALPMSEKGDNGAFRNEPSCGATKRWVDKHDANASDTFSCLAAAGTNGAGIEMPLYALKLALNDRMADGTNAGFRRDDALLGVVVLTDEDDCSREDNNFTVELDTCPAAALKPVSEYAAMLDVAAKGPGRWATAVLAGEKSCTSSFGDAVEAKRLKDFVGIAGKNGTFASICQGDLSGALQKALDTFDAACKSFPGVR